MSLANASVEFIKAFTLKRVVINIDTIRLKLSPFGIRRIKHAARS